MNMDCLAVEGRGVDTKLSRMAAHILQGECGRLLHHISKIARKRQVAVLFRHHGCLNEENLTPCGCPGQAGDNSRNIVTLVSLGKAGGFPEQPGHLIRTYFIRHSLPAHSGENQLAHNL